MDRPSQPTPADILRSYNELQRELSNVSPYPGLRPFLEEESRFFRGRNTQIREIGRRLEKESCLSVLGGSGCGKSSIVRAGVVPALRRHLLADRGDLWGVAVFTPGTAPIDRLVEALGKALCNSAANTSLPGNRSHEIRDVLYGPDGLGGFLPTFRCNLNLHSEVSSTALEHANLLIVIDQFEELFRAENRGKPQTAALIELVVEYWKNRDRFPGLHVIITMRTDDLHRCAEYLDLPEFISATSYLTRRLREDELRDAIIGPVRPPMFRAGLLQGPLPPHEADLRPFDVQVVKELVDASEEMAHDPDHLPLMQHLLAVLWRRSLERWRRNNAAQPRVTKDDLAAAVGFSTWAELMPKRSGNESAGWLLTRCLEQVADGLYAGRIFEDPLTIPQRDVAQTAFCLMAEVDDRGNYKRRWTSREEIAKVAGLGVDRLPDIDAVIDRYYRHHRLIWVRDSGEIDVSHEALIRKWTRFKEWLKEDRRARSAYCQLEDSYLKWQQANAQGRWRWLCWLKRRNGFLGTDSLDNILPLLTDMTGRFRRLVPRHNVHWVKRSISYRDTGCGKPKDASTEGGFNDRLTYLMNSVNRRRFQHVVAFLAIGVFLISAGYTFLTNEELAKTNSELLAAKATLETKNKEFSGSTLWDGLGRWNPEPTRQYIDGLWSVNAARPAVRTEFVRQMPRGGNFAMMGYRPQPIVRAVGLRWPESARVEAVESFKQIVAEFSARGGDNPLARIHLACSTAALGELLDGQTRRAATANLLKSIEKQAHYEIADRTIPRILACLYSGMGKDIKRKVLTGLLNDLENRLRAASDSAGSSQLRRIIPNLAMVAWFVKRDTDIATNDAIGRWHKALATNALNLVSNISTLSQSNTMWGVRAIRATYALTTALPLSNQREALDALLDDVPTLVDEFEPNELLITADFVEIVAAQHLLHGEAGKLKGVMEKAQRLAGARGTTPKQRRFAERLAIPLSEAAGNDANRFLIDLVDQADRDYFIGAGKRRCVSNLDTVVWARSTRTAVVKRIGSYDDARSEELLTIAMKSIDRLSSTDEDDSGTFARAELAHLIRVLGEHGLDSDSRSRALEQAEQALAGTVSAEEAAAWSGAIVGLLRDKPDVDFVTKLVEVMKYPNAGLTARLPNAAEPRSATDVLIAGLWQRSSLQKVQRKLQGDPISPWHYREVIAKVHAEPAFAAIDLERPPQDPRCAAVPESMPGEQSMPAHCRKYSD